MIQMHQQYQQISKQVNNSIQNNQQIIDMKNRSKAHQNTNQKQLQIDSRAKIYVPINVNQNSQINGNHALSVPVPITNSNNNLNSNNNPQHSQNKAHSEDTILLQLKRANAELKQKQEIYIDKLIKLEQGLEKQHMQFMQLQDLYNELFRSYKKKQEQISELQQKYRETNRKKQSLQSQSQSIQYPQYHPQLKKQTQQQKQKIQQLEHEVSVLREQNEEIRKNMDKVVVENNYYKNKNKMNDSRASLNSKVFQQLGQWQKQADLEKQGKIKLQYQNRFLKSRNQDLQMRVVQLESIISQKQQELLKLRQNNIVLSRQNSQNRLLRSSSRSPNKSSSKSKQMSDKKQSSHKINKVVDELYSQNKQLKLQLEKLRDKTSQLTLPKNPKNQFFIRQQQFYSFSQDDHSHSNHSSNQEGQRIIHKQLFIKVQNDYEVEGEANTSTNGNGDAGHKKENFNMKTHFTQNQADESLQELPSQLQIQKLIEKNRKKQMPIPVDF